AHQLREEISNLVRDTSERMHAALTTQVPPAMDNPALLRKLYDDAETVDAHFRRIRSEDLATLTELASAADDYLLTSREILLRWASSQRYRLKLSASIRALENHMRADDRTAAWITEAVRAKERVEEDYRDYNRAMSALSTLLASFPAAREKMAPQVDATLLTDARLVASIRTQVIAASAHATGEMERIRQLRAYR
ncbi:MAG TPA: hypothetical protein VFP00_12695, partial [Burkholderiales bacterium]|nr:hypothetical protein [Burkholderiales bacterium]